jgi:GTP-binding protein HflX
VEDKLFATLDTTVRALRPESVPRILVSDTVGFIKKLPHDLVASFRSTLDEALEAGLLLYVADASDPTFRSQLEVTRSTLAEIGADVVPSRLLLNKVDRLDEAARAELAAEHPDAVQLSAKDAADIARLREMIIAHFESSMVEAELVVPYAKQKLVAEIYEAAQVLSEEYDEAGARVKLKADPATVARLESLIAR